MSLLDAAPDREEAPSIRACVERWLALAASSPEQVDQAVCSDLAKCGTGAWSHAMRLVNLQNPRRLGQSEALGSPVGLVVIPLEAARWAYSKLLHRPFVPVDQLACYSPAEHTAFAMVLQTLAKYRPEKVHHILRMRQREMF